MLGGLLPGQFPLEQPLGVLVVRLGIAAGGHVEEDAGLALLRPPRLIERDAQLGLADPRGPGHHRQRAWQQPAAHQGI